MPAVIRRRVGGELPDPEPVHSEITDGLHRSGYTYRC